MRALVVVAGAVTVLVLALPARAHWAPAVPHHNARHAVNLAWCGSSNLFCRTANEAWAVAGCETGGTWSQWATNGQYLGMFQFGAWARQMYGFGWNPWAQAWAAYRYWRVAGWQPWTCASVLWLAKEEGKSGAAGATVAGTVRSEHRMTGLRRPFDSAPSSASHEGWSWNA